MSMVPLVPELISLVKATVLQKITCRGVLVSELIAQDEVFTGLTATQIVIIVVGALMGVVLLAVFGWQYNIRLNVGAKKWLLTEAEVTKSENLPTFGSHASRTTGGGGSSRFHTQSGASKQFSDTGSRTSQVSGDVDNEAKQYVWPFWGIRAGHALGETVVLFESRSKKHPYSYRYDTCKRILFFHKSFSHDNIMHLFGLMRDTDGKLFHVYRSQAKSSLHHILATCPYDLNEEIKFTLASDVCKAMAYLHKFGIKHGILDTWNCLMDSNWSLRIADWSQTNIAEFENDTEILGLSVNDLDKVTSLTEIKRTLFRHPDFYTGMIGQGKEVMKFHDLYSFSMVLIEIFTRKLPYADKAESMGWLTLFKALVKDHRAPSVQADIPQHIKNLIDQLAKNLLQVTFDSVLVVLEMSRTSKKGVGIVDTLMKAMEEYMGRLEEKVAERTVEMQNVMKRMDELLKSMLPAEVANALQNGQTVEPKLYENVTIYFSDIIQFDQLSSSSTPLELVNFLNALYTFFDRMIERYDVYKVETIGDAYMCASGLPRPNGDNHAAEIVRMALSLIKGAQDFKIPHRPKNVLKIRVGVNTGSVMAGVIGLKMPRYCLFGDAVNVASRMESTGLANRIQAADSTVKMLEDSFPGEFLSEYRGETEVKGKGMMKTYWILEGTESAAAASNSAMSTPLPSETGSSKVRDWQKD